jgi:hypothetical protein
MCRNTALSDFQHMIPRDGTLILDLNSSAVFTGAKYQKCHSGWGLNHGHGQLVIAHRFLPLLRSASGSRKDSLFFRITHIFPRNLPECSMGGRVDVTSRRHRCELTGHPRYQILSVLSLLGGRCLHVHVRRASMGVLQSLAHGPADHLNGRRSIGGCGSHWRHRFVGPVSQPLEIRHWKCRNLFRLIEPPTVAHNDWCCARRSVESCAAYPDGAAQLPNPSPAHAQYSNAASMSRLLGPKCCRGTCGTPYVLGRKSI